MIKDELVSLIIDLTQRKYEEEWYEFKENWFEPHEIGEYISSLSNGATISGVENGLLIWGISDDTHQIVGTNIDYKKNIKGEPFANYLMRQLDPKISIKFEELEIYGKRVVVLLVSKAINSPTSFDNVRYVRLDSSKVNCAKYPSKEAELWKVLIYGTPSLDNIESTNQNLSFNQLLLYFASKGINLDLNNYKDNLGLLTQSKKYNKLAYILSDNCTIPIRVSIFAGKEKSDSLFSVKEFGNMCMLLSLDKISDFGDTFNIMQADERNRKLTRTDVALFDIKSFKEALINAFVHNRWIDGDAPQIEFYQDRVEILSHGRLIPEQTKEGFYRGQSKPVNKSLSTIFIQLHISEKTGKGIPTIVKRYGKDVFEFNDNSIVVKIPFNWINVVELNVGNKLGNKNGEEIKLTTTQQRVLAEIRNNPSVSTFSLMSIIGVGQTTIENSLSKLKSLGLIERVGAKKKGYWKVVEL